MQTPTQPFFASLLQQVLSEQHNPAAYQVVQETISDNGSLPGKNNRHHYVQEYLLENLAQLHPEVIQSYFEANSRPVTLQEVYGTLPTFRYCSSEKLEEIFREFDRGWETFNALYPDTNCLLDISAPGFSAKHQQALLYVGKRWDVLGGIGRFYVYQRTSSSWEYLDETMAWIS